MESSSKAAPSWLPDPRDKSQYPIRGGTPLCQWKWEFLRRSPRYQRDWAECEFPVGLDELDPENPLRRLGRRYGIDEAVDPARSWPAPRFLGNAVKRLFRGAVEERPEHEVILAFDPRHPIDPQLENARWWLEYAQRRRGVARLVRRPREIEWQYYLRALDADARGMTVRGVAAILYDQDNKAPDWKASQRVRAELHRARQLRDGGYRELVG